MNLLPLQIRLSKSSSLIQSNGLRKSIRQTPALIKVMFKLIIRRERYMMQLLKYFVLFPGQSNISQDYSIDSYDRLFFSDDAIHSMVKIYEVKELQNLIWGFLNLKALKYLECCKQLTKTVQKVYQKRIPFLKKEAFQTIKQYDIYVQNQNNEKKKIGLSKHVNSSMNTEHREKLKLDSITNNVKVQNQQHNKDNDENQSSKIEIKLSNNEHKIKQNANEADFIVKNNNNKEKSKLIEEQNLKKKLTKVIFTYSNKPIQSQKKINRSSSSLNLYRYSVPESQNVAIGCKNCCTCCSCGKLNQDD